MKWLSACLKSCLDKFENSMIEFSNFQSRWLLLDFLQLKEEGMDGVTFKK